MSVLVWPGMRRSVFCTRKIYRFWKALAQSWSIFLHCGMINYRKTSRGCCFAAATRSCTVVLQVAEQYLGDVAGYQSQVSELEEDLARKDRELEETAATLAEKEADIARQRETIAQQAEALAELEAAGTADQVDAQLRAAYTEGVEQNG